MSTPENILDRYNTYAYHHIFIACDSTSTAEDLARTNNLKTFERVAGQDKYDLRTTKNGGNYIIVINGMQDAEFVIDNLTWLNTTATSAARDDQFTSIAVEGSFDVQEPRGVRFFNVMNTVADNLDTDPQGIVWMIKTVFVGHGYKQGTDVQEYITNIRPLMLMIYDITAEFRITGGEYKIQFAGVNNGGSRFPQTARIVEGITINPELPPHPGSTLKNVLKNLEAQINQKYNLYFACVADALSQGEVVNNFRRVTYAIDLEPPYDDPGYVIDDTQHYNVNGNGNDKGGMISFGPETTIESAIHEIMGNSSRVKKDASEGIDGRTYTYKIVSIVDSSQSEYKVVYKVRRFEETRNDVIEKIYSGTEGDFVQRNLITFDYFFTGKNTDVLNLDLKMEMGMAFFQTLTSTNNVMDQRQHAGAGQPNRATVAGTQLNLKGLNIRKNTPLFPDTTFKNQSLRNSGDPASTIRFNALLARHAAVESLEAKLEITGNPHLMSAFNKLPSEMVADPTTAQERTGGDASEQIFTDWDRFTALAKVNIYMPKSEEDLYGDFGDKFWYDGYYYIYSVENTFSDGVFRQTLDLMSLPTNTVFDNQEKKGLLCQTANELNAVAETGTAVDAETTSAGSNTPTVPPRTNG